MIMSVWEVLYRTRDFLRCMKELNSAKKGKVDFILAVGGGSVIDSAKAIGYGLANDCDVWELYLGQKKSQPAAFRLVPF